MAKTKSTGTALAPNHAASKAPEVCARSPNEAALLACRQEQLNRSATGLEAALEQLRQRYRGDEPESLKLLESAQAAWRSYQQAECRFKNRDSAQGSAYQVYLLTCLAQLTEARLKTIKETVDNP